MRITLEPTRAKERDTTEDDRMTTKDRHHIPKHQQEMQIDHRDDRLANSSSKMMSVTNAYRRDRPQHDCREPNDRERTRLNSWDANYRAGGQPNYKRRGEAAEGREGARTGSTSTTHQSTPQRTSATRREQARGLARQARRNT